MVSNVAVNASKVSSNLIQLRYNALFTFIANAHKELTFVYIFKESGREPTSLDIDYDNNRVYFTDNGWRIISFIDIVSMRETRVVNITSAPGDIVLDMVCR